MRYRGILLFCCLMILPLAFLLTSNGTDDKAEKLEPGDIISFQLSLDGESEGKYLDLRITKKRAIRELLVEPLRQATLELRPARYEIIGGLKIEYQGGVVDYLTIFFPWGHYKHRDKYMIADFTGLKNEFKKQIDGNSHYFK